MLLKDKVSIITGGGSGIGRATAMKFAQEGAKVVVADFNNAQGHQVADQIVREGEEAMFVHVDVSDFAQVEQLVAAKGAVKMMTQAAGLELAPFGIRVVAVGPGAVNTPILQGYRDAGLIEEMAKKHMGGRVIEPEAIANAVAFLASEAANAINGSLVMLDDGYAEFK